MTPDMLDVLHDIEDIAEDRADINWHGTGPNDWMRVLELVREVIRKATGGDVS